jgi:hypothetical protein
MLALSQYDSLEAGRKRERKYSLRELNEALQRLQRTTHPTAATTQHSSGIVMLLQVSEARRELRDCEYEAEVEHNAKCELQSKADVMRGDCATQLRAADALRGAIAQRRAASEVLAQARTLEDVAAARNVTTVILQNQAAAAKCKVGRVLAFST